MSKGDKLNNTSKPRFDTTCRRSLPPVILEWPEDVVFQVPPYLVPSNDEHRSPYTEEQAEKRARGVFGVAAFAIQEMTSAEQADGLSLDRPTFRATVAETNDPVELVVAMGFYASLLTHSGEDARKSAKERSLVIYQTVRDDMSLILSRAHDISRTLSDEEAATMYSGLSHNMLMKFDANRGDTNYTVFTLRNALFDIVGKPDSVLDPETVMGTRLLKYIVENRENNSLSISVDRFIGRFTENPANLVRNPELYFLFEQAYAGKKKVSRSYAEQLVGGTANGFFDRLDEVVEHGSFEGNIAKAYRALADKVLEQHGTSRRYASGSSVFIPTALTSLAKIISNNTTNIDEKMKMTQVDDIAGSFEYVLGALETEGALEKVWPGVAPETRQTFITMLLKVIKVINQPLIQQTKL